MSMTIIEKIIASHARKNSVKPDDIVDVFIDTRAARDFGGANVVKNLLDNGLTIHESDKIGSKISVRWLLYEIL